jgi:ATP-binding cassette subfamily C (CFTR/MRP) protein 1
MLLWFAPLFVTIFTIFTYQIITDEMDFTNILVSMQMFTNLFKPIRELSRVVSLLIETIVSLTRIEKFLDQDDIDKSNLVKNDKVTSSQNIAVEIKDGNFSWGKEVVKENVIKDNKFFRYKPSIDVDKVSQTVSIESDIPSVISESQNGKKILKNINLTVTKGEFVAIIGETGSGKSSVIHAILNNMLILNKDKASITLNGRVSYVSQTAWVQNDTVMNNILFNKPYEEAKYNNMVEMCQLKPDFQLLAGGDKTELGDKGAGLSGGQKSRISIARALYSAGDIFILDDPISALDATVGENIMKEAIVEHLKFKTRILVTHAIQHLHFADRIILMQNGEIAWQGTYKEFEGENIFADYVTKIRKESLKKQTISNDTYAVEAAKVKEEIIEVKKTLKEEEQEVGSVKKKIYFTYIRYMGGVCLLIFVIFCLIMWQTLRCCGDFYYIYWSKHQKKEDNFSFFWKYALICTSTSIFVMMRILVLTRGSLNCSKDLHTTTVKNLIKAPINLFHDIVPKGQIFNRLNKDMFKVDTILINSYDNVFVYFFGFLGAVVICSIIEAYSLICAPFIVITCWLTARFYIKAGRDLTRIDGIIRSDIVSLIGETIPGIATIRASEYEEIYRRKFYQRIDEYFNAKILYEGVLQWFGMHLEFLTVSMLIFLVLFCIFLGKHLSEQEIGLILYYGSALQSVVFSLVISLTTFENGMVSMERVLQYKQLISEKPNKLPTDGELLDWPSIGSIKFINYSVRYRPDTDIVLKNINLEVKPQQKIVVVGRTGSGKSTLCLALFRILEADSGSILIDDIDITNVELSKLRQSLTIIPQDPHLIEGTLRYNIDPLGLYNYDVIKRVMQKFGLWYVAESNDKGLDQYVNIGLL